MEGAATDPGMEWMGRTTAFSHPELGKWQDGGREAAEAEFPLFYPQAEFTWEQEWWERRTSEWAALRKQYLPVCGSLSVEQLKQRFSSLEVCGGELVWKLDPSLVKFQHQHQPPHFSPHWERQPLLLEGRPAHNLGFPCGSIPAQAWCPQSATRTCSTAWSYRLAAATGSDVQCSTIDVSLRCGVDAGALGCPKATATPSAQDHLRWKPREVGVLPQPGLGTPRPAWKGYSDNEAQVDAIMANLEGEAAKVVIALHHKGAPELADPEAFLGELRPWFVDTTQT